MNGFMHGSQGIQTQSNQAEFLGNGMVTDGHDSILRGLATVDSQQGNSFGYNSGLARSSDRQDFTEAPVSFDFLGGHQQLMRGQHPGILQPRPRQQPGYNDMHLMQQQLMLGRLQEIQRQQQFQQLQQLGQAGRQQNQYNQLSGTEKQLAGVQLPAMLSGIPIHNASNPMWSDELMESDAKTSCGSQILLAGNMNWGQPSGFPSIHGLANGFMFSLDHGQALRSMETGPQQRDHSLYGTPVINSRGSLNYSHLPVMSLECGNVVTKDGDNQAEKTDAFSFQNKDFQAKGFFRNAPVQNLNNAVPSESFQQVNHLVQSVQAQEFQDRQEQDDWSGNLQYKPEQQVGFSRGVTNLDLKETKLLFSTDDDNNWNSNMSTEGYLHSNILEGNDYCSGFSSIQSGSWSALMQEALGASSSDTGVQEKCGGLSVAKPELPTSKHSVELDGNRKQQMTWDKNKMQAAPTSTSTVFPLFGDGEKGSACLSAPSFQQSTKFAGQQDDRVRNNASHESYQQPAVEANKKQLDHGDKQEQFEGTSLQRKRHFDNVSNGVWTGQMHQQAVNNAADIEFNMQNVQGLWAQQQKLPIQNVMSYPSSKPNGWSINETPPHCGPNSLKNHDNDGRIQDAGRYDITRDIHMKQDLNPAVRNSNTRKINQNVVGRHQDGFGKYVAADSSMDLQEDQEPSRDEQAFDSSLNIVEKRSHETYNSKQECTHQKEVCSEGRMCHFSHTSQYTDNGCDASKNFMLAGNDPRTSVSGSQKSLGQSGHKTLGPRRFLNHPLGNSEIGIESASLYSHKPHSQGPSQLFVHGLKNQEQGYVGPPLFVGNLVTNNAVDTGKSYSTELQKDDRGTDGIQSVGAIHSHDSAGTASFDGSSPCYDQSKRVGEPSQNMLELLHKVDQSKGINAHARFSYSDSKTLSLTTELDSSNEDGSCLQLNQPLALQGVGLGLVPPAQARQGSNCTLPLQNSMQTSDEYASRHPDAGPGNGDQTLPPPFAHEASQREDSSNASISLQACNLASQSSIQANPNLASSASCDRNQHQQLQHTSCATGFAMSSHSSNLSFGNPVDANERLKQAAYIRQTHASQDGTVADQSGASLSGASGRVFCSRLASAVADSRAPRSEFCSLTGHSRPTSSIASHLSTGPQLSVMDPRFLSQSSHLSGTPQQGGFSTMLQNVCTNVLAQSQSSGVQPQKTIPNLLHPVNQLSSGRFTSPWRPRKTDDQNNRVSSSEFSTCPSNSEQVTIREESRVDENSLQQLSPEGVDDSLRTSNAPQGQKLLPKQLSDESSAVSVTSLVCFHQQEHSRGKHTQESLLNSQSEYATFPGVDSSNHDTGTYRGDRKSSDTQAQNYSLLQQTQALKGADSDLSERHGKRIRGADSGNDASQIDWKTGQRYVYTKNSVSGLSVDGELSTASQRSSFPSGVKMLSFSQENEEKSANISSQLIPRERNSQNLLASNEHPQISPHMAPTWFKQYGNYKNGQILAMYDGFGTSQHSAKAAAQKYIFGKAFENRFNNVTAENEDDASQAGSIGQGTSSSIAVANSSLCRPPLDNMGNNTGMKSKKRKSPTSELLPWHKEVVYGSRKLHSFSVAEMEWAWAANRVVEKVKDESEMIEDSHGFTRPRRRLLLTTQLMQQLFPSAPAKFLRENASTSYESVTYFAARSALGDACTLICCSGSNSNVHSAGENMIHESHKTTERVGDHFFSKVVEGFIGRSRKLESDFLRLDKRVSVLGIRMECQDLERCAMINRFAKFHGRPQTEGVEISSTSETVSRSILPQRQAFALPMPRNLPEGVLCLSL